MKGQSLHKKSWRKFLTKNKEMKKEKLIEILTEMMAISPSRNWDLEARSNKWEKEEMRNRNKDHILEFTDIILEEIKNDEK